MTVEFYRRLTEENPILTLVEGEKYMGMWQADARHGQAVLVTPLDGLYIEGASVSSKSFKSFKSERFAFFPIIDSDDDDGSSASPSTYSR